MGSASGTGNNSSSGCGGGGHGGSDCQTFQTIFGLHV